MSSCDSNCDLVLSAIKYSKFDSAKKLCDILSFKKKHIFSYFYGIVNLALSNETVAENIVFKSTFLETFAEELKSQPPHSRSKLCFETSFWELNFALCAQDLRSEIIDPNSDIRKLIESSIVFLRPESEIDETINAYALFEAEISNLSTEQLISKDFKGSQFCGGYSLDLTIGRILLIRSEYYTAKSHFERAFFTNPYEAVGFDQYSTILWHLNEKDKLFALYLKFKKYHCRSSQYYIVKGNHYSFNGANEKAINSFRQAINFDSSATYALFLEGHDWLSLNNVEEAEKAFEKLCRLDPETYMPYFGLGIVNYKKKKYQRSLTFLNLAKSLNPYNYNIACYCSIVLESLERKSEALDVLLEETHKGSSVIYFRKAKLYEAIKDFSKAEDILKEAIEFFPNDPALFFSLAEIYNSRGQISAAVRLLKRVNELELSNPAAKDFINTIGI